MKEETKKWIEAGRVLQSDATAKIQCPECGTGILLVEDAAIKGSRDRFDRYLICDNCGKWNVITMRREG